MKLEFTYKITSLSNALLILLCGFFLALMKLRYERDSSNYLSFQLIDYFVKW